MAHKFVVRRCGHEERVAVPGSHKERDRKITYEQTRLCSDCYRATLRNAPVTTTTPPPAGPVRAAMVAAVDEMERRIVADPGRVNDNQRAMMAAAIAVVRDQIILASDAEVLNLSNGDPRAAAVAMLKAAVKIAAA